ncbi:7-cyano-7-deazaguanine synthase [Alteromonas stellipolaris]|uniref:7-cyano-7-deazaguanine synthase n=1 Tax=Alteromonas stellipolaris TaxID=233316 RepID=UPI0026E1BBF1|nr:7-cyano-7-deazaguanine synthase [Alteromonas stellipolaris]MDO6532997.1 7-cyano-7-deazaguanine synthase [Alteromonas stellipolaris]MDO6624800.1 7-cyano-7-deazaguanine synthase [Alteromonas stellipolaris]
MASNDKTPKKGTKSKKTKDQGKKVLILLSGGPDSATLAKMAEQELKETGGTLSALFLKTGHPKDKKELEAANRVANIVGARLEVVDISDAIRALGGKLPTIHSEASIMRFGNSIVMSLAMAYAFEAGHDELMIGLHKDDALESLEYTRPYMDRIQDLADYAYEDSPKIKTPFLDIDKVGVFTLGKKIGVDYSVTWSCIRGEEKHCGTCGACRARRRAFNLVGIEDKTDYAVEPVALDSVAG